MNGALRISILSLMLTATPCWGQQADGSAMHPQVAVDLSGDWVIYLLSADSVAPTPPPVYASYRPKDEKPLESHARLHVEAKGEGLAGSIVLPDKLPMEPTADMTGHEAVPLESIMLEGDQLRITGTVPDSLEVILSRQKRHFIGEWKTSSGLSGKAFLYRWPVGLGKQ